MKGLKMTVLVVGIASVTALAVLSGSWDYIKQLNEAKASVNTDLQTASIDLELLREIETEAARTKVEPIDAKVDSVWKAVPGYNGQEVNIDETYKRALKRKPGEPISYVYQQIPAKVTLDDLGKHPIYRGNPNKPMVSFMINVAWGNEFIEPMLKVLDEEKIKTTFFLDGSWLKKNPELAAEILKRGHEVENHAYSHPNMSQLSQSRAELEIAKTQDLLKESLGINNRWFAPPSGDFNQQTVNIAYGRGLKTVLWTLDTVDWRNPSPESVVQKITKRVEPGFLILMHPTSSSSQAMKGMIRGVRAKGLHIGTVSETLSPERILPYGS